MTNQAGGPSLELRRTIVGQPDSLGRQRSHFLTISADVTQDLLVGGYRSVPSVVLPYQLLITVSVTGELAISELSTSPTQPGNSSPTNLDRSDLSESPLEAWRKVPGSVFHPAQSSKSESQLSRYPIRQSLIQIIKDAYTLLISSEPALVRAVYQSPNENAKRLNEMLLNHVQNWTAEERYRRLRDEDCQ